MNNVDELTLDLPNFTGPLDLLLHLIRSQKIMRRVKARLITARLTLARLHVDAL